MLKNKFVLFPVIVLSGISILLLSSMVNNHKSVITGGLALKADTEENRFTKTVLSTKLDEPLQMIVFKDHKVLFIERKGNIKLYNPVTNTTSIIAKIPVSTKYVDTRGKVSEAEDGLLGVVLDPDYEKNHWLYLYYSAAGDDAKNILTRYEYINDELVLSSKKVLLEVPVQREQCCHTGGKMAFDGDDNLYLTTGDNTSSKATVYSPADEREGRSAWDAQKSSSNTNDLRGKILRIHPEKDGSYTIPEGNLFPKGTDKTKPEIYVMGIRNPYSLFYDKRSKYLYWGEVGPDAGKDSVGRGPRSYDEYNRTQKPGFFGWPYFQADNKPYNDYNFETRESGPLFDPEHPVNNSPNNTGLTNLPPTQKSFIWYSYEASPQFPVLGTGGRSAMLGPIYYADDYASSKKRFPDYYDGKLFIFEWLRDWIIAVTFDENGNYKSMERFLPGIKFSHPMDLKFGPDGDMYVLEYGQGWFTQNNDAQLVRISYNAGNRKPNVLASADNTAGGIPLKVKLSATGTSDFDNDDLNYKWTITTTAGKKIAVLNGENTVYTFTAKGLYKALLTVTDSKGGTSSKSILIKAGNHPPVVNIAVTGNQQFYFPGKAVGYAATMRDREDGSIPGGKIAASRLKVNIDYQITEQDNEEEVGHKSPPVSSDFALGKALILKSDCKACHDVDRKIIGPSYKMIEAKYTDNEETVELLANKIINGGNGVWGEMSMAAHPQIAKEDAKAIVKYVLNVSAASQLPQNLPAKGTYVPVKAQGPLALKVMYTDNGVPGIPAASAQKILMLKSPVLQAAAGEIQGDYPVYKKRRNLSAVFVRHAGSIKFTKLDVTGVNGFVLNVSTPGQTQGGKIEVRLDNASGEVLGMATVGRGLERENIPVKTKLLTGVHDIYLIFKADTDAENLFYIDSITLLSK